MPSNMSHRRQTARRSDMMKVTIEDVNLTTHPYPVAQGRDRRSSWGLFNIDLSHGVGGSFPTPTVGEVWWIKRSIGSRWVLDHKVDPDRSPSEGSGGSGGGDSERSDVPTNVELAFNVREKKTQLEYQAFVTFDAVTEDENGDPANPEHYVIDWVPCSKVGNIIADENVRQHIWSPNDPDIDEIDDPAADYYVILPGNVPRPKVWYWKARVRAVSTGGAKGEWSDWTEPVLPIRASLPSPPYPQNIDLEFRWKDTDHQPVFSAITVFDDVNYWDIPGFDYEDDITSYEVVLQPLQRRDQYLHDVDPELREVDTDLEDYPDGTIYGDDGHFYVRADPNNDGKPWPVRRQKVKDKDSDTYVTLGTMGETITKVDTIFDVDEAGLVGTPVVPFVVQTSGNEQWLVYDRTLISGTLYTYEVYRQFQGTSDEAHSSGSALRWLKDKYVYHVDFHRIERPRTVYWRTRVRSKDRFNRYGDWSPWTAPVTPWQSIDWQVPKPRNLSADIQIREYKTHPQYKLVAKFKDAAPNGWNLPGGDLQDDLAHYNVMAEALLPDVDGYIDGGDGTMFRIPDRRVGQLASGVVPSAVSMTVDLDADLVNSMKQTIDASERFFLRIETPNPVVDPGEEPQIGYEVVAVTAVDEPLNSADLSRVLTIERAQKGSVDHEHRANDAVYLLTEHVRRKTVHDKDENDPGHFNEHYSVDLGHIPHSGRLYWHVRARSVDTFGHKSEWTAWTSPLNPANDPDLIIDAPGYVRLDFDRVHRSRWNKWRAIVEFKEVDYTAPDGDREADVTRYSVQLATSDGDELDIGIDDTQLTITVLEKRKSPDEEPFLILINDEIMEVTARVVVIDKVWAYTVNRAQNGTTAAVHPDGARVYEYPFLHQSVSAKTDKDKNNFNRSVFPKAQKFRHYKARVRAHDRYNRNSEWTAWTADGTPSDHSPPPVPTNVLIDVDNHKIVANWDYPTDVDDNDPDLAIASDEAAYFQVQLSDDNFQTIHKFARYVAKTREVWRVKKPGMGTWYIRVRAVDGSGNKSAWVSDSGAQNGVPTPDAPTISYDILEVSKHIRALVLLGVGVTGIDDDVDGYEFELQPAEFHRLHALTAAHVDHIYVNASGDLPPIPFVAFIQKERLRVTHVNTNADRWQVVRGLGTSTPAKHRKRTRVQYFRNPSTNGVRPHIRRNKTGTESAAGDPVLCVFNNIQRGLWYRARVRARNTKGLWGDWSAWSRS